MLRWAPRSCRSSLNNPTMASYSRGALTRSNLPSSATKPEAVERSSGLVWCVPRQTLSQNWVNDLQFLTRILTFQRILLTKSETKKMYKKVWSDISVYNTINRADIWRSCRVGTLYSIVYQRQLLLITALLMVLYTEISDQTFCTSFSSRFWSIKSFETNSFARSFCYFWSNEVTTVQWLYKSKKTIPLFCPPPAINKSSESNAKFTSTFFRGPFSTTFLWRIFLKPTVIDWLVSQEPISVKNTKINKKPKLLLIVFQWWGTLFR